MKKTIICLFLAFSLLAKAETDWVKKADYGGGVILSPSSFTIDNYAYVCAGTTDVFYGPFKKTTYRYDPIKDVWKKMSDLPVSASNRANGIGFSINGKGYITGGTYRSNFSTYYPTDVWEYNPGNDQWYQRASFPRTGGMDDGIGFAIGDNGYAGLGYARFVDTGIEDGEMNDFYSFNPKQNKWTRLNDFPGAPRQDAIGFSMNGKGYVGLGYRYDLGKGYTYYTDMWEYDPETDEWDRLPDFPGEGRTSPIGFGIEGGLYIGLGSINDFYKYDLKTKEWISLNYMVGATRYWTISFCVNNSIFYGAGNVGNLYKEADIWEYKVVSVASVMSSVAMDKYTVFPNPVKDILYIKQHNINEKPLVKLYDLQGKLIQETTENSINMSDYASGIYILHVNGEKTKVIKE